MERKDKKYIFIDTTVYRNLFSESEDFSDEFLQFFEKLITVAGIILLLPQQVKDEIERNCIGDWFSENQQALGNKLTKLDDKAARLELDYGTYSKKAVQKIKKDIQREKKTITQKIEKYKKQFLSPKSTSRIKLNKLINLAVLVPESEQILSAAFFRKEKGNPPEDGSKLGDKIIWESLLSYLKENPSGKPKLIFVTKDKKAWRAEASEKLEFNFWLQKEYNKKTKGRVILIEKLSEIPGLTPVEQEKIKDEEERESRRNIIFKLKTSVPEQLKLVNTFAGAEKLMHAIESKLDLIDKEGIEQILKACVENVKHSTGPYNQAIDAGYAPRFTMKLLQKAIDLNLDLSIWKDFYIQLDENNQERFYDLRKLLQDKGVVFALVELKYVHVDDIPF